MRIVVFGTGLFFQRRKHMLPASAEIIAFIDNDVNRIGSIFEGVKVYSPLDLPKLEYDKIVLASTVQNEMRCQLKEMGIDEKKICYWEEFIAVSCRGVLKQFCLDENRPSAKKCLIIVHLINYSGGVLAGYNLAVLLQECGYDIVIASPVYDEKMVDEIVRNGIQVWICPSLLYVSDIELKWIEKFDFVICNTLHTFACATNISNVKNLFFWIHEYSGVYDEILGQYESVSNLNALDDVNILAVSNIAKNNFLNYFNLPREKVEILPFGIKEVKKCKILNENRDKIVFSMIANLSPLKNQIQLVNVIKTLPREYKDKLECRFIGREMGQGYASKFLSEVENDKTFEICGEMSPDEIAEIYDEIDVVVCASVEETMSMSIVEGLRGGKICLTNNNTGIAEYIRDGENGFIYGVGEDDELKEKIKYIIDNYSQLQDVRYEARKTYEKHFSLDVMKSNIHNVFGLD